MIQFRSTDGNALLSGYFSQLIIKRTPTLLKTNVRNTFWPEKKSTYNGYLSKKQANQQNNSSLFCIDL